MNKKELMDLLYEHRIKIFLFGMMIVMLTVVVVVHDAREVTAAKMTPEFQCSNLGYYNDYTIRAAEQMSCEYNETGWHYKEKSTVCGISRGSECLK